MAEKCEAFKDAWRSGKLPEASLKL